MNITGDVRTWILAQITTLYGPMSQDNFGLVLESLVIRGDPSSANVKEFCDGSTAGSQPITFYARSKSPTTAISALDSIMKKFNQPQITLTDVFCASVYQVTTPTFVSKEETGESIYSMTVNVDFDGKNQIGV